MPSPAARVWFSALPVPARMSHLALVLFAGVALAVAWFTVGPMRDDALWLAHADRGMVAIWTEPSPYQHFRPVFGTWLRLLQALGVRGPSGLALAGVALASLLVPLTYGVMRERLPLGPAWIATALLLCHPARREHLVWASAQIDLLCLVLSMLALRLALAAPDRHGAGATGRVRPWIGSWVGALCLFAVAALACWTKETAAALPIAIALLLPRRRRLRAVAVSTLGAGLALACSAQVLHGLGRPGWLVAQARPMHLLTYAPRLLWPGDFGYRELLRGAGAGQLGPAAQLLISAVLLAGAGLVTFLLWRRRPGGDRRPASFHAFAPAPRADLVRAFGLIALGGVAHFVSPADRNIWFGLLGFALWAGLTCWCWPRVAGVAVLGLLALWIPLWSDGIARARLAQQQSRDLEAALSRAPDLFDGAAVLIGLPRGLARQAYTAWPMASEPCLALVVSERSYGARATATRLVDLGGQRLRIEPTGPDAFLRCLIGGHACSPARPPDGEPIILDLAHAEQALSRHVEHCGPLRAYHYRPGHFEALGLGGRR